MRYENTPAERQSNFGRVRWAEGLIQQLPATHDGRNSWLLNFGTSKEAAALRVKRGRAFDSLTEAAATTR